MVMVLEESTVTAKGQTTVPAAVRNALGLGYGARVRWRVRGNQVVVSPAEDKEHDDPALNGLLLLIERDISSGRNISGLPRDLVAAMQEAVQNVHVDLDEPLDGDVAL